MFAAPTCRMQVRFAGVHRMRHLIYMGLVCLSSALPTGMVCAAGPAPVSASTVKEGDRPLQRVHLPELMSWQVDYSLNNDTWTLKNSDLKPRQGSYATGTLYIQQLGSSLPLEPKALSQALTESGALEGGMRFSQIDRIESVPNGYLIVGQTQSDMEPTGKSYAGFVMIRHLQGANVMCRQGSASDLADPVEWVKTGVEVCRKLSIF
jgi:hypothetical protein